MGQIPLSLSLFLGQNVTFESVLALDLAGTGKLETLLGTGLGLHFRHRSRLYLT